MKVLDCESIELTYQSLEDILGINKSRLNILFDSIDIYDGSCSGIEPIKRLYSYVLNEIQCQADFDATYFFHCTRTKRGNEFEEGLLPLNEVIDKMWDFLFDLTEGQVTPQQWADFRHSIESSNSHWANLYTMKLANAKLHGGPHASLIKETTIKETNSSKLWNYFEIPEIIDDICKCCPFKINLRHKFTTNTAPYIVKFIDYTNNKDALLHALLYAYHKHRHLELSDNCNTCFSGKGQPVPKNRIITIKEVSY